MIKRLFVKSDIKFIRRWILCATSIFIMGFATLKEFIISIIGVFPLIILLNIIEIIVNKLSSKKTNNIKQ